MRIRWYVPVMALLVVYGLFLVNFSTMGAEAGYRDDGFYQDSIVADLDYSDESAGYGEFGNNYSMKVRSPTYVRSIYPDETRIKTVIRFHYSEIEEDYYYTLEYSITVVFLIESNATVTIPMAQSTLEGVQLIHNGEVVQRPDIKYHDITVKLSKDIPKHTLEVRYRGTGRTSYGHATSQGVFLSKFDMELEVFDPPHDVRLTNYCMRPSEYTIKDNYTSAKWNLEDAVLDDSIYLSFQPQKTDPIADGSPETFRVVAFIILMIFLTLAIATFFYLHFFRKKTKKDDEPEQGDPEKTDKKSGSKKSKKKDSTEGKKEDALKFKKVS